MKRGPRFRALQEAWAAFMAIPFPARASLVSDEIGDCYGDLVLYDSESAGLVSWVLDGKQPPYHLRKNPELRARLSKFRESKDAAAVQDAKRLLAYLDEIEHVVDVAAKAQKPGPK